MSKEPVKKRKGWSESDRPLSKSSMEITKDIVSSTTPEVECKNCGWKTDSIYCGMCCEDGIESDIGEEKNGCDECLGKGECGWSDGCCLCICHNTDCENCVELEGLMFEVKKVLSDKKMSATAKILAALKYL